MTNTYLTPIDDNYETCERTKAVFRVHCGDRSPRDITKILRAEPTKIIQVGIPTERRGKASGPIGRVNSWMIDSEVAVTSKDLRTHLDWILERIEPSSSQVIALRQEGLIMDIFCVWWSKFGEGGAQYGLPI